MASMSCMIGESSIIHDIDAARSRPKRKVSRQILRSCTLGPSHHPRSRPRLLTQLLSAHPPARAQPLTLTFSSLSYLPRLQPFIFHGSTLHHCCHTIDTFPLMAKAPLLSHPNRYGRKLALSADATNACHLEKPAAICCTMSLLGKDFSE